VVVVRAVMVQIEVVIDSRRASLYMSVTASRDQFELNNVILLKDEMPIHLLKYLNDPYTGSRNEIICVSG